MQRASERMATMLHNRLVDACVVVGMDEQTGLLPLPKMSTGSDYSDINVSNVLGPFQINVLGVFTGTMAFFPCHHTERISGEPFYPETSVICPMASDVTTGTQRKMRRSMSFAPTAMPFSSEVVHSLPPFYFPDGGLVYQRPLKPYMHYVVLTNLDGGRTYGCGLIIARKFSVLERDQLSGGYELDREVGEHEDRDHLYVPFCVCLISKWPYFNTMKDMLSSLLITLKTSGDPWPVIMKFASNVASILVPPPGDLSIEIKLFGNDVIVPSADELDGSVMDLDLHLPMLMLSVEDILKVIACILAEQRLIFICSSQAQIPLVIECFFTFVEPFKWRRTYVPILPHKLADLIEAPGPFIMGCHSRLRSHIKQVIRMEEIPSIVVVDLDKGSVEVSPNEKIEQLPQYVTQALVVRLRLSKYHYDLELMKTPTFYDVIEAKRHRADFIHEFRKSIKAACLDMMVSLFADVLLFMRVGERLFDKEGYIKSKFDEDQGFFEEVCASDAFDRFVDDRLENPSKRDTFAVLAEQVNVSSNSMTRKRSTSNMTRVVHRTSSSYRLTVSNPKAVFKQPPLLNEGLHTGKYYESCIDKLTEEIESRKSKSIALKASYLYLRGMLYLASNQPIKGLDDFHALYSANQELFPTDYVQDVIANLDASTEELLEQQDFYKRAAIFRIFKKKTEEQTTGRPTRKLPNSPLEHSEFEKRVKALQIAISDETAERLFATLTHQRNPTVSPEQFALLYNTFTKMEREIELVDLPGVTLEDDESRVLCSPPINTTRGVGRLIITTHQLFFVGDGLRESFLISRLRDIREIIKYQHYVVFPPGVPAVRIVSIDPNSYPFFACLKEDRELWVTILNEMAGGHDLAHSRKDPKIIYQAANNVTLANVLVQMDIPGRIANEVCYFARKRNTDRAELSDETREVLERRLDPNMKEPNRTTVTCVTYVPGNTLTGLVSTVWCGLGSGTIIVYEVIGWTCLSELRYAKHRISCLVPVGESMVWAGSFDSVIYVINTDTRKAEQQLQNHTDFVSDIVCIEATPETGLSQDVTWSASFCGQIIRWNPETREKQQEISLQKYTKTLSKLMIVGDRIWCGSSDTLLVVDAKAGDLIKKLRRTDDIGIPIPMECFGLVEERKIWGFGRQNGDLFVWNTTSYDCKQVPLDNDVKASSVLPIGNKAWIGCKDGKVFVLDHSDYTQDRELNAHTDKVTCICLTDEGHVITGSSSKEGKLCVWNTMVWDRYDAAVSLGFDVLDCGLRVKSKLRSRRPSQAE